MANEFEVSAVTIHHTHLPDHGDQYRQGWIDYYFQPIQAYFQDVRFGKQP